jgi:hypothetical protein
MNMSRADNYNSEKTSRKSKLTKVTVEFPRHRENDELNLLINDDDFLANLSISDNVSFRFKFNEFIYFSH